MKNFSAKTADFDSISISGEAPIVQSDLGTAPNQIPLNKDLGTLAYMDSSGAEDVNADTIELREIAAELSETAVDVFVYDTRKDSDGGAWRSRTSHTSWYNEELNTATRGGRREFPAVAVIVAEANKVTIYDGDDPDLSMWMVFNASSGKMIWAVELGCVSSLNARMSIGSPNGSGIRYIDFISDKMREWRTGGVKSVSGDISKRNSGDLARIDIPGQDVIVNQYINDVAMTVLPNTPIDGDTGLPVPTIAVATDGGVSVIRDDGSVVDISGGAMKKVSFDLNNQLHLGRKGNNFYYYGAVPSGDVAEGDWRVRSDVLYVGGDTADIQIGDNDIVDIVPGVIGLDDDVDSSLVRLDINKNSLSESMINFTNSRYNTGWMPGDIKLATLSDTKVEKVGVDESAELINLNDGYATTGSWTIDSNTQVATTTSTDALNYYRTGLTTQSGKKYTATLTITNYTGSGDLGVASLTSGSIGSNLRLSANGTITIQFNGSNEEISLFYRSTNTATMELSIKETGELITNGTFDNDSDWEKSSHWTISGGFASMPSTSDYKPLYQYNLGLTTGVKYVASIDVSALTGELKFDTSSSNGSDISEFEGRVITSTGIHSLTFVAESNQDGIGVARRTGTTPSSCTIKSISVRLAEDDRSVNDNGLQIFGEITKTPVATGADLVAYSGFSAENYLMQPYNSDLDFGTGDFCIMGWARSSDSSQAYVSIGPESATGARLISGVDSGGHWFFTAYDNTDDGNTRYLGRDLSASNSYDWVHFFAGRRDGVFFFYLNNKEMPDANNNATDLKDLTNTNASEVELTIGANWAKTAGGGELALVRISKTVPTPEQIAKIYRDERALFTDGAQATLYGTSDAVTALAYDDSENLLHVGTASGRSSFNGLKRVENTDVAVTTAISATEGLVIEQ